MKQSDQPPFKEKTDLDNIRLFIREGEGLTLEFKERYPPRMDEDILAFVNTRGGILLLGARDDGIVVGERLTNGLKAKINSLRRELQADYYHCWVSQELFTG
jgi:predicted HTH transcriptional regulator